MIWLERQRYFIDFTLSSLLRRKGKNLALLLVYTLIVFMVASVIFFADAIRKEAGSLLRNSPEMIVQRMIAGRHDFIPLDYVSAIKEIRGVRGVEARLWGYYYHPASRANFTVMAPEGFSHGDREVVVGPGVLRGWNARPGEGLYFRSYDGQALEFTVAGEMDPDTALVSGDLILMSPATFREVFGVKPGYATDVAVSIRNEIECPVIAEKINSLLPDTRTILREDILRTYSSVFDWRSGYVIVLLSGAILAFFIFAWDKATGLSAEEKGEIGVLKAIGWESGDILLMKFWEGAVISLTAFFLGAILAYIHVFVASAPLFERALKGWSVLYPVYELRPSVNMYQLAVLFSLSVVPYTIMTIIPIWRVSVTDPDTVMKQS